MTAPTPARLVTPEAAAAALDAALFDGAPADERLLDAWATIVGEPDRTRAAVVKALRLLADEYTAGVTINTIPTWLHNRASDIENGAPL